MRYGIHESSFNTKCLVLGGALLVRGMFLWLGPVLLERDTDAYGFLASQLQDGQGYAREGGPTAFRPPLYPLMLYVIWHFSEPTLATAVFHLLLGVLTVWFAWSVACHCGFRQRSLLVAALVAIDPLLLFHSGRLMTETLFTALLVLWFWVLITTERRRQNKICDPGHLVIGAIFGLMVLCRPGVVIFFPFVFLGLFVHAHSRYALASSDAGLLKDSRLRVAIRTLTCPLVAFVGLTAVVSPWVIRNWYVLGVPVFMTTHGGQTFWRANNNSFYDECVQGDSEIWSQSGREIWEDEMRLMTAGLTEVDADRACYRAAWNVVTRRPFQFAKSVRDRVIRFWKIKPRQALKYPVLGTGIGVFYLLEIVLALVAIMFQRGVWRWPFVLFPLSLLSFTLLHSLYWSNMRMRAPLMPVIIMLAVVGGTTLMRKFQKGVSQETFS